MAYTFKNCPPGWEIKKMPQVVKWGSGGTPKATVKEYYEGGTIPWLIIGDLNDGIVTTSESKITELGLQNSSAKMIPEGTLLVAMYGSIGKLGITGMECCTNQAIAYAKELYGVTTKYMFYFMAMIKTELISMGKGGTQKNISQTVLNSLDVIVPPIEEQNSIVTRIEELLSQLDEGVQTLLKTQEQLELYRQSVLKEAFEGKYVCGAENEIVIKTISDFASVDTGATPLKSNAAYYGGSIPWVSSAKINDEYITDATDYITAIALKETNCKVFKAHTILVALYGEGKTRGKCAELMIDAATNQALAAITINDENEVDRKYLKWYLTYNYQNIRRKAVGGVQPNLSLGIIKDLKVPLFSIDKQKSTVSEIESRISVHDSITENINMASIQISALRQSILKKAFEGGL